MLPAQRVTGETPPLRNQRQHVHTPISSPVSSATLLAAPLQVVVVGENQIVYLGVKALIQEQPDLDVLHVLSSYAELPYLVGRIPIDVLVLDGDAEPTVLRSWLRKLVQQGVRCLVLCTHPTSQQQERMKQAGALGCLSLREDPRTLFTAIRRVGYGQPVFYPTTPLLPAGQAETSPECHPAFGRALQLSVNQAALEQARSYLRQDFAGIDWGLDGPLLHILPHLHLHDSELAQACGLSQRQVRYWCSEALYPLVSTLSGTHVDSRAAALAYLLYWHIIEFEVSGTRGNEPQQFLSPFH